MDNKKLTKEHIKLAEQILSKGDRVTLVPMKDGIKVIRNRQEVVKDK